jgi:hypothetical protein
MTGTQLMTTTSILAMLLGGAGAWAQQAAGRPAERPVSVLRDGDCVQDCRDKLNGCLRAARQELAECSEPCEELRLAAREACAADPGGEDCLAARLALRECLAPCEERYRAQVAECHMSARACAGECPPADDVSCARRCLAQRSQCYADARESAKACRERCSDLIALARRACAADPSSDTCSRAGAAARQCVASCARLLRSDLHECQKQLRACLARCDANETPPATVTRPGR